MLSSICHIVNRTICAALVLVACGICLILDRNDLEVVEPPLSDIWKDGVIDPDPDLHLAMGVALIVAAILLILSVVILGPEVETSDAAVTISSTAEDPVIVDPKADPKVESALQDTVSADDAFSSQEVTPAGSPDLASFLTASTQTLKVVDEQPGSTMGGLTPTSPEASPISATGTETSQPSQDPSNLTQDPTQVSTDLGAIEGESQGHGDNAFCTVDGHLDVDLKPQNIFHLCK